MASLSNERRKHVFASLYSIPTQGNCKVKSAGTHILILREEVFQDEAQKYKPVWEENSGGWRKKHISYIFTKEKWLHSKVYFNFKEGEI